MTTIFKKKTFQSKVLNKEQNWALGHHFGGDSPCVNQDLSIQLIEQVEVKTLNFLAERDLFWQQQIRAYV